MEFLEQIQKDRKIAQDLVNNKIAADIGEAFKMIQDRRHMQIKTHTAAEQNIDGSLKQSSQAQTSSSTQVQQIASSIQSSQAQTTSNPQSSQTEASQEQAAQISSDAAERLVKIEEFLQKFDKFFAKFYDDTNAKLNDFSKSINALNFQMEEAGRRSKKEASAQELPETSVKPVTSSGSASVISNHQLKGLEESGVSVKQQSASSFRQKDGNYKPEDVAVEMIFNNSHNRLTKR